MSFPQEYIKASKIKDTNHNNNDNDSLRCPGGGVPCKIMIMKWVSLENHQHLKKWKWLGWDWLWLVRRANDYNGNSSSSFGDHFAEARKHIVRFPNSLAFGSELGLHYPYRRGIFLLGPTTQPIVDENGQLGAYWIRPHLLEPHAPSHFCSLTGFVTGTPCSSSTRK